MMSLGHNSSAIFTDGTNVAGYEQERLDRVKSSSAPPVKALEELLFDGHRHDNAELFATHWFDKFDKLPECKYTDTLLSMAKDDNLFIKTHSPTFTHHDAHAYSAHSFFKYYVDETLAMSTEKEADFYKSLPTYYIVADGFGNRKEVFSVYKSRGYLTKPNLEHRVYGYGNSLGLMYQYATKFCGMKMNQDEYKFLGYESQVGYGFNAAEKELIENEASIQVGKFIDAFKKDTEMPEESMELINYTALTLVEGKWFFTLQSLMGRLHLYNPHSHRARVAVAYYIQTVVERTLEQVIAELPCGNIVLSGGLFYNVKLNNSILKRTTGLFSVVPLAGDQGASIGFYEKYIGNFNWKTLNIGTRSWENIQDKIEGVDNVHLVEHEDELHELLYMKLASNQICNLVTDKMEFGPRALGGTSSLFLPTEENSRINNKLNQRNEVMPFAPMVLSENMHRVFDSSFRRVVGSDRFMVVTYDYAMPKSIHNGGVYHNYPVPPKFSGRPQVIHRNSQPEIHRLLVDLDKILGVPMITNTSYNYHGEPIVFRVEEALDTHKRQMENSYYGFGNKPDVSLIFYKSKE